MIQDKWDTAIADAVLPPLKSRKKVCPPLRHKPPRLSAAHAELLQLTLQPYVYADVRPNAGPPLDKVVREVPGPVFLAYYNDRDCWERCVFYRVPHAETGVEDKILRTWSEYHLIGQYAGHMYALTSDLAPQPEHDQGLSLEMVRLCDKALTPPAKAEIKKAVKGTVPTWSRVLGGGCFAGGLAILANTLATIGPRFDTPEMLLACAGIILGFLILTWPPLSARRSYRKDWKRRRDRIWKLLIVVEQEQTDARAETARRLAELHARLSADRSEPVVLAQPELALEVPTEQADEPPALQAEVLAFRPAGAQSAA